MGAEAVCTVRFGGKSAKGKALLETEQLWFRAEGGEFRLKIPFRAMGSVTASDGELRIDFSEGRPVFELGELAAQWAEKILHPKALIDKLGVKAGALVCVVGVTDENFLKQLRERTNEIANGKPPKETDWIFLAAESTEDFRKIRPLTKSLKKNGGLWIVYPKGQKNITENEVLAAGRKTGLKDHKVASFSATHTALKFVIPVSGR
jgi:hypothetical protein